MMTEAAVAAAAVAEVELIVWCAHQVEPDPAEMAAVLDWTNPLVCSG